MRRWITAVLTLGWILAVLVVASVSAQEQGGVKNVYEVLTKEKAGPAESWKITPLLSGPNCTLNLVQLVTGVKAHYHQSHDEVVYVVRGNGLLILSGKEQQVGPGTAYLVPQGAVHQFVNLGPDAAVILSVFSPPFDGKDRIFVEE